MRCARELPRDADSSPLASPSTSLQNPKLNVRKSWPRLGCLIQKFDQWCMPSSSSLPCESRSKRTATRYCLARTPQAQPRRSGLARPASAVSRNQFVHSRCDRLLVSITPKSKLMQSPFRAAHKPAELNGCFGDYFRCAKRMFFISTYDARRQR